jgi:transposase InsO family protein
VTPDRSRRQEESKQAKQEWDEKKRNMDQKGLYINAIFNKVAFTHAFIDNGCLCYMTVSSKFARKADLQRIPIKPRRLQQATGVQDRAITEVAYGSLDIDGHRQERVFAYVIPGQHEDVIMGLPWQRSERVRIKPEKGYLDIRSTGIRVKLRDPIQPTKTNLKVTQCLSSVISVLIRQGRKRLTAATQVFAVSLADIEKALRSKTKTNPRDKLPPQYHEFLEAFNRQQADRLPPHRTRVDHAIEVLKDDQGREKELPTGPLYSMSREELIVLRKTLTELLDKNFIRASHSPASAPVLFVKKPGGGLRFCVDYRKLNEITRKDRYPLPLITETLRQLSRAKWFTKLDVIAAFNKIRIKEGDEWKTAFRTRYGLYEWLVTPFGLTGAPATFQRYINWALRDYLDEFCTAYIDDVLIFSDGSLADHRSKVKKVLARLQDAGLQLDIDKSEFEVQQVKYLGYIIEANRGVRVDPEKVAAIKEWKAPTTVRGVRGFLGFANYYREFIPQFSHIATPLNALTKKDVPFLWTDQCQEAFEVLQNRLINAPLLAQWDPDRETVVETDSSGYADGGCLAQYDDQHRLRPVAYFSKKKLPAEVNYPIHDKEMLAVILCLKQWDAELRSTKAPFTVLTDHKNLQYFMDKQRLTERQMRWALELSKYRMVLKHRPGKLSPAPDALSRRDQDLPQDAEDERLQGRVYQLLQPSEQDCLQVTSAEPLVETMEPDPDEGNEWEDATEHSSRDWTDQSSQGSTTVQVQWVMGGDGDQEDDKTAVQDNPPTNPFENDQLRNLWDKGLKANNRYWLIRQAVQRGDRQLPPKWGLPISISECSIDDNQRLCWRERIWVPNHEPLRTAIIQQTHDSSLTGHPGRDLTKALIGRRFMWPGLSQDVRQFLRNCDVCGRANVWREQRRGLLKPLPIPDRVWADISVDFITDLPPSGPDQVTTVMVITDRLFKSVIFQPMTTITTESVADALMECLIRHHGTPRSIVSDRGPQFVSHVWKRICDLLKIKRRLSTAFHPETDGATERTNQELERYLRCFTTYLQDDWKALLPMAMIAINNRTATSTGMSPFFATHGYHIDPISINDNAPLRTTGSSPTARGEAFVARLQKASEFAQASIAAAQERQEYYANENRQVAEQFRVGDKVWLRLKNVKTDRPTKKLDWVNAKYTVLEVIGSHACRLDTPPGIHNVFHVMLLKRTAQDPLPSQKQDDRQPPALTNNEDGEEFEVESILGSRKTQNGRIQVHVKWTGYARPTWEPLHSFLDTAALKTYEDMYGSVTNSPATTENRPRQRRTTRRRQEGANVTG